MYQIAWELRSLERAIFGLISIVTFRGILHKMYFKGRFLHLIGSKFLRIVDFKNTIC